MNSASYNPPRHCWITFKYCCNYLRESIVCTYWDINCILNCKICIIESKLVFVNCIYILEVTQTENIKQNVSGDKRDNLKYNGPGESGASISYIKIIYSTSCMLGNNVH